MDLKKLLDERILIFDGAMGTMLQEAGLPTGELPEMYNLTHPQVVTDIHRKYVLAGSDVVSTNTFQANALKLASCGKSVDEIAAAAIKNAKAASPRFVAYDMGPTGQLLKPMGTLSFEQAYGLFAEQAVAAEKHGADIIIIETFSDLYEAKAAVLAAKENTNLPVICSLSFQADGRTFVGCDPVSVAITLSGLGVDALGVNCSLGPDDLLPVVERILAYSSVPVIVQANAGLPVYADGKTSYAVTPAGYAASVEKMAMAGVGILGGCCGTTPDFIRELRSIADRIPYAKPEIKGYTAVCSGSRTVFFDNKITVIGERINPAGKKKLKEALRENRMDYILGEAIDQMEAGAEILDVNVGLPELDEPAVMANVVAGIQSAVDLPLQIDSADAAAIEAGVRFCNGRPLINSVNGKAETMARIFPIAKKYGAPVVGLTLDENGIPATAEGRLEIARRIVKTASEYGIPPHDILIDCLVLTASAQQSQVKETLRAIRLVKAELSVKTVLGVSNVSFGLPNREILNATFLSAAFGAGLDAPILNPLTARYREAVDAYRVLDGEDNGSTEFIARYGSQKSASLVHATDIRRDLKEIIMQGRKDEAAPKVEEMLQTFSALQIVDEHFIPALNAVGEKFEKGNIFLPQLMQSADAVRNGFEVIKAHMNRTGETRQPKGRIIMATVEGDIHDIGKNIVRMILENYGYEVLDLGKDVPAEAVVDAVRRENIKLVGLSALMTTTVQSMKKTILQAREAGLDCSFFVGGAVLSPEYAEMVGAQFYARDAMESVEIAGKFFGN